MEKIPIREYARRCGCSEANIRKVLKSGKIKNGVVRENGKPFIIPDIADKEWRENINPNYNRNAGVQAKFVDGAQPASGPTVQEIKRAQAAVDLKTSQLKLEQLSGSLVARKEVEKELFAFGQLIREQIMNVPVKIVDDVRAAPTRVEALNIITDALTDVLQKLSETQNLSFTG